jgi:hypothetical protein
MGATVAMLIAMSFGLVPDVIAADHPNPINTIEAFCKTRFYFSQSGTMIYRWTLTMACIDRYASSSANAYIRGFSRSRIAYRIVLIIVIIWIILPVHNLIFRLTNAGVCTWSPAASGIYNSIFTITLGGIIPPLIMITCAVLIMRNLKHKRGLRRTNTQTINAHEADRIVRARDRQILLMLFIENTVYIILTLPYTTFLVYSAFTSSLPNKTSDRIAIDAFMQYLTETLAFTYSTLPFYLYTLASHTFRQKLIQNIYSVLKCNNRCCNRHQRVGPNQATIKYQSNHNQPVLIFTS